MFSPAIIPDWLSSSIVKLKLQLLPPNVIEKLATPAIVGAPEIT